jgi:hypothetical protein
MPNSTHIGMAFGIISLTSIIGAGVGVGSGMAYLLDKYNKR